MTKEPAGMLSPCCVKCGSKKPCFVHQASQPDSTTAGMYALWWIESSDPRTAQRGAMLVSSKVLSAADAQLDWGTLAHLSLNPWESNRHTFEAF